MAVLLPAWLATTRVLLQEQALKGAQGRQWLALLAKAERCRPGTLAPAVLEPEVASRRVARVASADRRAEPVATAVQAERAALRRRP